MKTAVLVAVLMVTLSGCAATVNKSSSPEAPPLRVAAESSKAVAINITGSKAATASNDWEQLKGEWRAAMKAATTAAGIQYSEQDGNPRPTGQPGTLVVVQVNDYRYLSAGARYGFGVMTGNAYIDSKVHFMDLRSGASYGERVYNTSSTAWQGIFSAMTAKQIEAICREIVAEITARP